MSANRTEERRRKQRAFRPTLDGDAPLESRQLLSGGAVFSTQTANGGRAVIIHTAGGAFEVTLTNLEQGTGPQVSAGTVRAFPLPGGKVGLVLSHTTVDTDVTINPVLKSAIKGAAHQPAPGPVGTPGLLNIGSIIIQTGEVGAIEGYHTAILSGPITVINSSVTRIAFAAIDPGAAIAIKGDLDDLDVLGTANFSGGAGLIVGRDLDWFNAGGDFILNNGASVFVGRDIGLFTQPPRGTGPGGAGGFIVGSFLMGPTDFFIVGRSIDNVITVDGDFVGFSRVFQGVPFSGFSVKGNTFP